MTVTLSPPLRWATQDDAAPMAELVNMAGEGLPLYLWGTMAGPGETAWDVGRNRARREEGGFSYRNTVLLEADGRVVASLTGYPLADDMPPLDTTGMPAMFVPLEELEHLAPGTWYVNVLAAYPEHRHKGHGTRLLGLADDLGRAAGKRGMSVIVSNANTAARKLYERCSYAEVAMRPMLKERWENRGTHWVLLTKQLS